jgi:hypothetical protein
MDIADLFEPLATGALDAINAVVPIAIPVVVALVGLSIAIRVFGKFGIKR